MQSIGEVHMATGEADSGLLATIQDTTDWGFLLLLRVVVGLPMLFFGVMHTGRPGRAP